MKKRVALAQALVAVPDVLLLDEPTNHLDLDSMAWLEELLRGFKGSVMLITHDRAFLDGVATRIVELDRGLLRSYPGNFSAYERLKEEQLAAEALANARADKLLAQEEVWVRKGVEARRTRSVARMERLSVLRAQRQAAPRFAGPGAAGDRRRRAQRQDRGRAARRVDALGRDAAPIVERLQRHHPARRQGRPDRPERRRQDHAAETDPGRAAAHPGQRAPGHAAGGGLLRPDAQQLDLDATLADSISPGSEWVEFSGQRKHVMSYLNDFLFSPERANSPVRTLSGGERNRVLLARLFALPANVLVLDEPTNDLDIDTLELLEELLQDYAGTVFLVSHDRRFLDNVVTSTIAWEGDEAPGRWREYEGGYEDWKLQRERARRLREAHAPRRTPRRRHQACDQAARCAAKAQLQGAARTATNCQRASRRWRPSRPASPSAWPAPICTPTSHSA